MKRASSIALLASFAVAAATHESSAGTRTVGMQTRVTNLTGSDVYVHYSGAYIGVPHTFEERLENSPMTVINSPIGVPRRTGPSFVMGQMVDFTGDNFGTTEFNSNGTYATGTTYVVPAYPANPPPGFLENWEVRNHYTISDGHSHHFYATFYDRLPDGSYRAFASYEWRNQVNELGMNQCHGLFVNDPHGRLAATHARPEAQGGVVRGQPQPFFDAFSEAHLLSALRPAVQRRGITRLGALLVDDYASLFQRQNRGFFDLGPSHLLQTFGSTPNHVCFSQFWVLPPVPQGQMDYTQIGMRGWGGTRYSFAADFNGDGRADLASAYTPNLYTAMSRPDGTWTNVAVPTTNIGTQSQHWGGDGWNWTGDFDGDGKADLASAYYGNIFLRRGVHGLRSVRGSVIPNRWGGTSYTFVGDFNGDGRSDIASAYAGTLYVNYARVRPNPLFVSSGTPMVGASETDLVEFDQVASPVPNQWGGEGWNWVGDFNGDGRADIASLYYSNLYVKYSNATGGPGFTQQTYTVPQVWAYNVFTFAADFTGDRKTDLLTINGGTLHLFVSTGNGFVHRPLTGPNLWGSAGYTRVGDFNGDGIADIASANRGEVYLHHGSPTGMTARQTRTVDNWWGDAGYTFVGDFNGDHRDDIATAIGAEVRIKFLSRASAP